MVGKKTIMVLIDQAAIAASFPQLSKALYTGFLMKLLDCERDSHFKNTHKTPVLK